MSVAMVLELGIIGGVIGYIYAEQILKLGNAVAMAFAPVKDALIFISDIIGFTELIQNLEHIDLKEYFAHKPRNAAQNTGNHNKTRSATTQQEGLEPKYRRNDKAMEEIQDTSPRQSTQTYVQKYALKKYDDQHIAENAWSPSPKRKNDTATKPSFLLDILSPTSNGKTPERTPERLRY